MLSCKLYNRRPELACKNLATGSSKTLWDSDVHMTWIYEKFLLQLDTYSHWPSQCHRWYVENHNRTCNPHGLWQKATVWFVINRGVSYSPRHMLFNTKITMKFTIKGLLLISTKWSNHGCFPRVLKCFADISYSTQQSFEKRWQTKVPRSYWAKQKYGESQNLTSLKLLDRISSVLYNSSFNPGSMNTWQIQHRTESHELDQKNAQGWSHLRGWLTWNHGYPRERLWIFFHWT